LVAQEVKRIKDKQVMFLSMFLILKCSTEEKGTENKFKCIRREANENNETQCVVN
jgi:hypothetical protein